MAAQITQETLLDEYLGLFGWGEKGGENCQFTLIQTGFTTKIGFAKPSKT